MQHLDSMSFEATRKMRRWFIVLCAFAIVVVAISLVRRFRHKGDVVMFRLVDSVTGEAITNATVVAYARWTDLPIEKLGIERLTPWKTRVTTGVGGILTMSEIPRVSESDRFQIYFHEVRHFSTVLIVGHGVYRIYNTERPAPTLVTRTNMVTISLDPKDPKQPSVIRGLIFE